MQTCYNCGKQVSDETLICPDCGALVRRYTTPPQREEQEFVQSEAAAYPTEQQRAGAVFVTADGRRRLSTGLKIWLVLSIAATLYLAIGYACSLLAYQFQDLYLSTFESVPELAYMTETFSVLMEIVGAAYGAYVIMTVVSFLKVFVTIWFMISKTKVSLLVFFVTAIVLSSAEMIAYSGVFAVITALDALIVYLWIKKSIPVLK